MILSDKDIKKHIAEGKIKINPEPNFDEQLGPCSLDLHLGNIFKVFKPSQYPYLDLKRNIHFEELMEEIRIEDGAPFILQPKDFILCELWLGKRLFPRSLIIFSIPFRVEFLLSEDLSLK